MATEFKPTAFEGRRDRSSLLAAKSHAQSEPAIEETQAPQETTEPPAAPALAARRIARPDLREARQKLVQGRANKLDFDYELLTMFARN